MANKVRTAQKALWDLLVATLPDVAEADRHRNPAGHKAPRPRQGAMVAYMAMVDDTDPEVLGVLCGPAYELRPIPRITLAFAGGTKDERQDAAYAALELLKAALAADTSVGGTVDYADVESAEAVDAADTDWIAGGLDVRVALLLTAPTKAG